MKEIIFLSGKRYVGKTSTAKLIKEIYEERGKKATIMSFSYLVKKIYCEKHDLDLGRFLTDHEYKDSHRVPMTQYFASTDQMIYAEYLHKQIKEENSFDVYVVDDLRLLMHVEYINNIMRKEYQITIFKINSDKEKRKERGWVESDYDREPFETELDNYSGFDGVFVNNGSFEEYSDTT